jgi:hypothetical protein
MSSVGRVLREGEGEVAEAVVVALIGVDNIISKERAGNGTIYRPLGLVMLGNTED